LSKSKVTILSMLLLTSSLKEVYFIPIDIQFSSEDMVQLLNDRVYSLYELLLQIILDREIQHSTEIFWKRCKLLGIESIISTAYYPQTNRQIEYID